MQIFLQGKINSKFVFYKNGQFSYDCSKSEKREKKKKEMKKGYREKNNRKGKHDTEQKINYHKEKKIEVFL